MNRTFFVIAGMFSASSLLLFDSAVKGAAILAAAACAAMVMRRDSAATRHLIWLLAIIALLAAPMLSAVLPQWRVLPEWTGIPPAMVAAATSTLPVAMQAGGPVELPQKPLPVNAEQSFTTAPHLVAKTPVSGPALAATDAASAPPDWGWNWLGALPLVWAIGFAVLFLRLAAARLMLWNTERQAIIIRSSGRDAANRDHLTPALEAACLQLEITCPVSLLIHAEKTIPVVWGILRYRLLLPATARDWSDEQLRSVLLHELAHVKRRDTLAQLLAQFACALHWFNPLAWFAAWRLGVERERACDDLVLAHGVRPSAYAEHLLKVVTACSPIRWTQSCGLAMARKSSLEGRLVAVLSDKLNRRGVSLALAAIALAVSVGIAVPIAMLRAADEKPGEKPAEKSGEKLKPATTNMKPQHEYARSLFQKWQASARTDDKIPGALIGQLAREIDSFLKQSPRDEISPKLAAIRPRLDASHDWSPADAVALLDDISAISTAPANWVNIPWDFEGARNLRPGKPLPVDLASAAWGTPAANGLRAAWLLEPVRDQYPLGSVLKARVLFHNAGKTPVIFKTDTWHQYDHHTARDAKGNDIKVTGPRYSGITLSATYRLAPGEYCEVMAHGIAIGAGTYEEEFSTGNVGAVIEAKEGDDVRLSHTVDATPGEWSKPDDPKDPAELWKKRIAERVERESPMPQSRADREQLIRRVTLDIFGVPATDDEIAAFVADNAPDALAKLTASLQAKPRVEPWTGKLPTGVTKFHVTAADPDAAKKPKTATAPGRYVLGDNIHLLVSQTTTEARRTNKAVIAFLSPDPKVASPHKPYTIELPDGLATYGIAWERGTGMLWVVQKGLVRKYDFTNPDDVKETRFDEAGSNNLPEQFREPLKSLLGAPVQQQESLKPKGGEKLKVGVEQRLKWGNSANGLRAALVIRNIADKANEAGTPDLYLVVQNVSDAAIHFNDTIAEQNVRYLTFQRDDVPQGRTKIDVPTMADATLQPREVTYLRLCPKTSTRGQLLAAGMLKEPHMVLIGQITIEKAPAGAWTGTLVSGGTHGADAQIDPPDVQKAPAAPGGANRQPSVKENREEGTQIPKIADRVYAKSGVPLDEQSWPMPPWGVEKDGLSSGIRVMPVETHVGGEVKVELWVRNSGKKDVKFNRCPRADIGLRVIAKDSNGADHTADITSFDAYPVFLPLLLPPGYIVKVKEFTVRFDAPATDFPPWGVARFLLPGGNYKLRAKWSDAHSHAAREGEWTGEIESAAVDLKVAATDAAATPAEQPKVAAETPKSGGAVEPKPEAAQLPSAPKRGATLEPGAEKSLKWGEAVNGLRAAISIRKSSDKPKPDDLPDLYLLIQNVSDGPIRLTDADVPANVSTRTLYHKKDGAILYGMGAREPALGNVMLQPREVVLLPMFDPDNKLNVPADPSLNKHTIGSQLVEGALKEPNQSFAARFEIAKAPAGAWTGKLLTADATAAIAAGKPQPKDKEGQALYEIWQRHARLNGNFPGGLIARLGVKVKEFIRNNTGDASGDPYAKKMAPIVPRLDATHDWTPADVISLFDDIAAVTPIPLETMLEDIQQHSFQTGSPLPPALAKAPWGQTQKNGLRMAYLLEPHSGEHPLGTPLKARILIHNAGKDVVVFRTRTWHQLGHKAQDAKRGGINVESVQWLTIGRLMSYRLWPGEFIELIGPGIGVGANKNDEEWQNTRVGSWVEAKSGDDVTITTSPLPLYDWNEKLPENGEPQWWLDFIKAHLALELPLSADPEERKHLVYRAGMAIFGTPLSAEEINSFVSDRDANALDSLAKRLAKRPGTLAFAGDLTSGPTKFRVLPPDPDAAKKPRIANNPGQYALGGNATLAITRRPVGERIANEATIQFSPPDATKPVSAKPHKIALPDGYGTWAAAWTRGSNVFWVMQRWGIWSYDFSDPADVKETHLEHAAASDKVPKPILDALRSAVDFSGVNGPPAASAPPAK